MHNIDSLLMKLGTDTSFDERFQILMNVVEYWHGAIQPNHGFQSHELERFEMPMAFRRWFTWAGRCETIMSGQNWFLHPSQWIKKDGLILFQHENQGVFVWATTGEGEDPFVFGRHEDSDPWQPQNIRVSEHLILNCLFEAVMCHAQFGANCAWLDEPKVEWLRHRIPRIPLDGWTWGGKTEFFAGEERFMVTMTNGAPDVYSVWLGAKSQPPLQSIKEIIDDSWEYVAL